MIICIKIKPKDSDNNDSNYKYNQIYLLYLNYFT